MDISEVSTGRRTFSLKEKACLQKLVIRYKLNMNTTKQGTREIVDRRRAWARLTQEFNSIGTNSNRTLVQLKKCWDNIKTRRKHNLERMQKMKVGEPYSAGTSQSSLELDPLMGVKNEDLPWSSDSDDEAVKEFLAAENNGLVEAEVSVRTSSPHEPGHPEPRLSATVNGTSPTPPEVSLDKQIRKREEELHKLRVAERMWLLRTVKEQHRTAQIQRERAELEREKAQFDRDKAQIEREKAHLELIRAKQEDTGMLFEK